MCFLKAALPSQLTWETSLRCSCHPVAFGATPGPPCARIVSHMLQFNIQHPPPALRVPVWDMLPSHVLGETQLRCLRGEPPHTRTPLLNTKALQGWGQLSVTLCHPDILPQESETVSSREGTAAGGIRVGCVGWMQASAAGQGLSAGIQCPGKGCKEAVM